MVGHLTTEDPNEQAVFIVEKYYYKGIIEPILANRRTCFNNRFGIKGSSLR
jgi:hypothetical protein